MDTAGEPVLDPVAGAPPAAGVGGYGDFARAERRSLVAFAWSLTGDLGAAEDLAQEALEAAWRQWGRVGGYDRPGTWARRVVATRAAGRIRRSGRERRS